MSKMKTIVLSTFKVGVVLVAFGVLPATLAWAHHTISITHQNQVVAGAGADLRLVSLVRSTCSDGYGTTCSGLIVKVHYTTADGTRKVVAAQPVGVESESGGLYEAVVPGADVAAPSFTYRVSATQTAWIYDYSSCSSDEHTSYANTPDQTLTVAP